MPRWLLDRLRPDSIAEFRAAAHQRSLDAIVLQAGGRRTAAVYFWGYAAEMVLKAAFFDAQGNHPPSRPITRLDLMNALRTHANAGQHPPLHHLGLWARALATLRASTPGLAYPDPAFGSQMTAKVDGLYALWRETLRYHKNVAYSHEMARARERAEWLLVHASIL